MINNRDIIIVGQQSWDTDIGSNCKNIAVEFSRHNRVLYVSTPLDRKSRYQQKEKASTKRRLDVVRRHKEPLEMVQDNLWVWYHDVVIESINWIKSEALFDLFNRRNNRLLARSIQTAIGLTGFKDYILFNDGDMFRSFYLQDYINPSVSVYYLRDNFYATDYWKKHGPVWQPKLIAKADVCVANSMYLTEHCAGFNPNSHYVGQGCDFSLFTMEQTVPEDIINKKKEFGLAPVIGYVGALLSARLNIALLEELAAKNQALLFVFVGPEDEDFRRSRLHSMPNTFFTGSKPPEVLPAYISAFDVCINPQVINDLTVGNYPRKIDEYLAMGKPVIATRTEAMKLFEEFVLLAETPSDYQRLLKKALESQPQTAIREKIAFAHSHSWENSVKAIYAAINSTQR
ncbi:glycosyltransferase [Niabella yanshanensis]|uniref:Glycosyltransferase n=1 Tax=Niabella yanshanensis TaxID=577386 RepID=A0ABZ0W8R1_9BACT|nr:glycosyltransferase [Niabella yanshanensis]WQD39653.1 glycosyltransferase [Niabella yanshanensis]